MNKQIEELANDLRALDNLQYNPNYTANYQRAVGLHSLGYRKASDVAREIIQVIDDFIEEPVSEYHKGYMNALMDFKKSIKKKYGVTEE